MTELAVVFGIEPGTVWVGTESSSESGCRVVARRVRRVRGVAVDVESESESEVAVADDLAFACCRCGTPVGRISFGLSSSGEVEAGSTAKQKVAKPTAQKAKAGRYHRVMGGKLAAKIQSMQAARDLFRAGSIRFRSLPAHQ